MVSNLSCRQSGPHSGSTGSGATSTQDWASKLPDSVSATVKVWKQSPDKARVEIATSSLPGVGGATAVYDGQKFYAYSPANNTLYTGTPDNIQQVPDQLKQLIQSGDFQKQIDSLISAADVKLLGEEQVAGIDSYKLDITAKPGAVDQLNLPQMVQAEAGMLIKNLHATVWVDKARWVPLKLVLEHPSLGQFTYTATQVALNQPINASEFVLQTPGNAKVVDLDKLKQQTTPQSLTLPEARDVATKAGWKLLEPSSPANATVVDVKQMGGAAMSPQAKGSILMLGYSAPGTNFSVVEGKGAGLDMLGKGMMQGNGSGFMGMAGGSGAMGNAKDVTVRGVTAKAFSNADGTWSALVWQEKDSGPFVAVMGNITVDQATSIAQGLK